MQTFHVSKEAKDLFDALIREGLFVELEYWDGHKHVDMRIPDAYLYIEVDGLHHFTEPKQIARDFLRDRRSSQDGYDTLRIPNAVVEAHLDKVVNAIADIVSQRS